MEALAEGFCRYSFQIILVARLLVQGFRKRLFILRVFFCETLPTGSAGPMFQGACTIIFNFREITRLKTRNTLTAKRMLNTYFALKTALI